MAKKNATIPLFALYGEDDWVENVGFVHCEDIAKRSSSLGWRIDAHRHAQLFQFLIIEKGHVTFWLDDQCFDTSERCVIWIPPGTVHRFEFLPNTKGRVISLTEDVVSQHTRGQFNSNLLQPLNYADCFFYTDHSDDFKQLIQLASSLEQELSRSEQGQALVAHSLIQIMLVNIYRRKKTEEKNNNNETHHLWWGFKRLLDQHYREHLSVADFAERLLITPSKLNRLSKAMSQQSIKFHTQQRLIVESKRKLLFTRQSIDEITYDLGFKDAGYFCRFFKKMTGMTPSQFREQHAQ